MSESSTNESRRDSIFPRTLNRYSSVELDKLYGGADNVPKNRRFANFMPIDGYLGGMGYHGNSDSPNVGRGPSRKWYDPEWTGLALLIPKSRSILNRWYRFYYKRDPIIGGVIDLHSELPFSRASLTGIEDASIKKFYEDSIERVGLLSGKLSEATNELLKIGEAFPYYRWDSSAGNFSHIILQNPDFIEIEQSMFIDEEDKYKLAIDPQLRSYIESTNPQAAYQKRKLPLEFVRAIVYGEKLDLPFDEDDLFIAIIKRDSPSDLRGNSIIARLLRELIYEDKLRDSQIAIADNFIYPFRMLKIGNDVWQPTSEQLDAFQELILQKQFDPNFWLITHNAVEYSSHSLVNDVMSLGNEWERIDKLKMIGLGMSQSFLTGESSYATAHVGWQTAMARYKSLRHLMEEKMVYPFFKTIAKRNGFYKISKKELNGQFRIARSKNVDDESDLIIPKLDWEKKLIVREDESYLQFLSGLMAKFPISNSTFLSAIGMSLQEELEKTINDDKLMVRMGFEIKNPLSQGNKGSKDEDSGDEEGGLFARLLGRRKKYAQISVEDKKSKSEYLKRVAINIHKLELQKDPNFKKSVEEIYSELLIADSIPIDEKSANFFVGVERDKLPGSFIGDNNKTYENTVKHSENKLPYELNYNLTHLNTKVISLLYDVDTELNKDVISLSSIENLMSSLVEESAKSVEIYVHGRNTAIDKDFILNVIKSDVLQELSRFSSDLLGNKEKIKDLALAAVYMGNITHYVNERVDSIRIGINGGYKIADVMDAQSKGITSAQEAVSSGVIPEIYPLILDSEDNLRKWNYITDVKRKKLSLKNCPRFISSDILNYIKIFSKYINSEKDVDCIIFGSAVEKLPDFYNYVREKYAVNDQNLEHALVENERAKFYKSNIFSINNNLYVNYSIFADFQSNYELFKYIIPVDIKRYAENNYDKLIKYFSLNEAKISSGLLSGWLSPDSYSSYQYRVASGCKNIYSVVDYYDSKGNAYSQDKEVFIEKLMTIYFDRKYLIDKNLSNLIG
jgi:hypothetical protein